jgi:hypothetical protein
MFLCTGEQHQHKRSWKQSKPCTASAMVHGTDKLQHVKAGSLHSHCHRCVIAQDGPTFELEHVMEEAVD